MRRIRLEASVIAVLAFAMTAAGCASGAIAPPAASVAPSAASSVEAASSSPASAPAAGSPAGSAEVSAIVGEWVGVHDCARILEMMHGAGLDEFALEQVWSNGLVPGVTTEAGIKDPTKPCEGTVERKHSHFFTADGRFGSKDFDGNQVDDGTYTVDGDVLTINEGRFHFSIDGDKLTLEPEPVDISGCTTKECRFPAAWVLMVAMPGTTWTRGTISG
jgi:hypothetical protein